MVTIPSYEGQVAGFLRVILGEDYEFKEHDKYLIIKYAPGKLDVDLIEGKSDQSLEVKLEICVVGKQFRLLVFMKKHYGIFFVG